MTDTCFICLQDKPCQCETSDYETRERMLSSQCGELAVSLRACEQQLVSCAHAYRRVSNFDESQRCSDIAMQARLVLKKWEEL